VSLMEGSSCPVGGAKGGTGPCRGVLAWVGANWPVGGRRRPNGDCWGGGELP
jgi:hypothetical protein